MTPLETDHIIDTRALDGNNFNLVSDFLRQNPINTYSKSNDTIINPATGLPMVGCLDVNGNSFGSNSSYDHYRRSSEDSYRSFSSTNNSSNYDPFTNRYQ